MSNDVTLGVRSQGYPTEEEDFVVSELQIAGVDDCQVIRRIPISGAQISGAMNGSGSVVVTWDELDESGAALAPGQYVIRYFSLLEHDGQIFRGGTGYEDIDVQ